MQIAVIPTNSTQLVISWNADPGDVNQYFYVLHISELFDLTGTNESRSFAVSVNNIVLTDMTPQYLYSDVLRSRWPLLPFPSYNITLEALNGSTLPPILNAVEIFSKMRDEDVASDAGDGTCPIPSLCFYLLL